MSTGILLSYKGLGANILHLAYCHEIAKVYGPVTIITLSDNFKDLVEEDPLIKEVIYLNNFHKKLSDILNLSSFIKDFKFNNLFIFYPSLRFYLAAKFSGVKNIFTYPLFKKKGLHLVDAAKKFVEKNLKIKNCPSETSIYITNEVRSIAKKYSFDNKKKIILGVGSSGPTTKWGAKNYISLIKSIQKQKECFYFLLAGPDETNLIDSIINEIGLKNCKLLNQKKIKELIPYFVASDIYVGNDSFGHHISTQLGKPSIVLLLDTPRAYSDYSVNHHQITPENVSIEDVSHNSVSDPDSIKVDTVIKKIFTFI